MTAPKTTLEQLCIHLEKRAEMLRAAAGMAATGNATETDDAVRQMLHRAAELAKGAVALGREANTVALGILSRAILENLILLLWVQVSESNAASLKQSACAELARLARINLESGKARVVIESFRFQKFCRRIFTGFAAEDLYNVFYRFLSLETHGLSSDPDRGDPRNACVPHIQGIGALVNNVLDANRVLARGTDQFLLGHEVYYRIYAERQHVKQPESEIRLLFRSGLTIYAPSAYWLLALQDHIAAEMLVQAYLHPVNPQIHALLRFAILFGSDFSGWLYERWRAKWGRHPQPPKFYWAFKEMCGKGSVDPRLVATRMRATSTLVVPGEPTLTAAELIEAPERAATMLSKACMGAFENRSDASAYRSLARNLDCYAYGPAVMARGRALGTTLQKVIGDRKSGDVVEAGEPE